jgi:hypothetical protein
MTVLDFHIMFPVASHVRVKAESSESWDEWCEFSTFSSGIRYLTLSVVMRFSDLLHFLTASS